MNVDLRELKTKVEQELRGLEERRSALQEQLSHVEAVQRFATQLGDDREESADSEADADSVSNLSEKSPRQEIFGHSLT